MARIEATGRRMPAHFIDNRFREVKTDSLYPLTHSCMSNAATAAKPAGVSNKPLVRRQFGKISVAVFGREVSRPDGSSFTAKDFVLQKSWKDKNTGDWRDQSISLQARDILAVQQALVTAFVDSYQSEDDEE